MKSAFEFCSLSSLSMVELVSSPSLNSVSAVIALPWCFSQCCLAAVCLSLSVNGGGLFFFFAFGFARFGWYPGWKNVGGVGLSLAIVVVVVVVGVVGVMVDAAFVVLLASVG